MIFFPIYLDIEHQAKKTARDHKIVGDVISLIIRLGLENDDGNEMIVSR